MAEDAKVYAVLGIGVGLVVGIIVLQKVMARPVIPPGKVLITDVILRK